MGEKESSAESLGDRQRQGKAVQAVQWVYATAA